MSILFIVPPSINHSYVIEELPVVIGSPAAMHCPAYGTPEPTIRWIREGVPITFLDHPNLRVQDGGRTLQIHNMQLMDIGSYTCVASNVVGNVTKEFLVAILGETSDWFLVLLCVLCFIFPEELARNSTNLTPSSLFEHIVRIWIMNNEMKEVITFEMFVIET